MSKIKKERNLIVIAIILISILSTSSFISDLRTKTTSQTSQNNNDTQFIIKVNVNTALKEELMVLPYIGPEGADAIIANRPIKDLSDLGKVLGIGQKIVDILKERIVFQ